MEQQTLARGQTKMGAETMTDLMISLARKDDYYRLWKEQLERQKLEIAKHFTPQYFDELCTN